MTTLTAPYMLPKPRREARERWEWDATTRPALPEASHDGGDGRGNDPDRERETEAVGMSYIGPDRRQGERRRALLASGIVTNEGNNHRQSGERRQEALSGVITGLTAEQMQELAKAWQVLEGEWPPGVSS